MIRTYVKEYGLWYGLYFLLLVCLLLTFSLYHLPLELFIWSTLFSLTGLLIFSVWQFFHFKNKMDEIANLNLAQRTLFLNKPSDLAYLNLLEAKEERIKESLLRSKSKEEDLQAIAKMWSHQMKVPLSALSLMAQTDQLEKQEVRQQLLRLEKYLDTMLTYLKFSENKDDFRFENCSARSLMTELVKKYRVSFLAKQLSVEIEGDWQFKSDKKWLSFALSQVLDNAIKYSKEGGKIRVDLNGQGVCISDQGIGILAEDLPRIFEEGFTGYNGHEHKKASGFGLYMTKQVLDKLDLDIRIESQVDIGTQVWIEKKKS